jgi:hypothetical protein
MEFGSKMHVKPQKNAVRKSVFGKRARSGKPKNDQRQQQPRVWRVADGSGNFMPAVVVSQLIEKFEPIFTTGRSIKACFDLNEIRGRKISCQPLSRKAFYN